jgi:hypothetical protein
MPRHRRWTDDDLRSALPGARSWKDVCLALDVPIGGTTFTSLREAADRLALDYGHLHGGGQRERSLDSDMSDEAFAAMIRSLTGWSEVYRRLGYTGSVSSNQIARWRRRCERQGIDISHFRGRGQGKYPAFQSTDEPVFTAEVDPRHLRYAAIGRAIAWFAERGYRVATPVEPAPYDLVVDVDGAFYRVQVKSSTAGRNTVGLTRTVYDKATGKPTSRPYEDDQIDFFFIASAVGTYVIPYDAVRGKVRITLGHRCAEFKVA